MILPRYRIFEIEPTAQSLYAEFGNRYAIGSENLFHDPKFIKHATQVVSMVTAAIGLLEKGDMETLISVLKELGARHADYGIQQEHYPIVGEALIETLAAALGDDFTPEAKSEWLKVADIIFTTMATTWG